MHSLSCVEIFQRRSARDAREQAGEGVAHDARLKVSMPTQIADGARISFPEDVGGQCQGRSLRGQVMRLAQQVCQRETQIESRVTDMRHFVIE